MNTFFKIIIVIVLSIFVDLILNVVFDFIVKETKTKNKKSLVTSFTILKKLKSVLIIIIDIIIILAIIPGLKGASITFLSGAGIITLILGYAAQNVLSDFFAGISVAFTDPFEIGDFIKCVDIDINGTVEEITLRHTIIRTVENRRLIIPNSKMCTMVIENYNHTDNEVCRFAEFGISYDSDLDKAISIIKEEMDKQYNPNTNGICKNVEFPKIRVVKWDESAIIIRGWVWGADNAMAHENIFQLNYNVKKRFDKENIEIPFNYLNVIDKTPKNKITKKK